MSTHFYHGKWHTNSGVPMQSINPANNEILWEGNAAQQKQVDEAVQSARQAFGVWSQTSYMDREAILLRYQACLEQHQEKIALLISQETGKVLWEAKTEAAALVGKVRFSIASYEKRTGTTQSKNGALQTQLTHRPHGVLVVLGPYNFPAHLPNGHIVPALLAGNTIIFKPSEITPSVGELLIGCLIEAGVPKGVVNLLQGEGETGKLLSEHQDIDGLLFTGSSKTGNAIHRQFAGQPNKMLALEMGGNNPLIFDEVADINAAVFHTIQSAYITSGQRCTCARRLIIKRSKSATIFAEKLIKATKALIAELPQNTEEAFMGPVVSNQVAQQLLEVQKSLISQGAISLVDMQRPYADKPLVTPALLDVTGLQDIEDEEYFGPLLKITWVDSLEEAIKTANNTKYGLAAGILTDNDAHWQAFYQQAQCGILNRNRPTTGASGGSPFGGIGASGNHRPSAYYASDYCAYPMASVCENTLTLPEDLGKGIIL